MKKLVQNNNLESMGVSVGPPSTECSVKSSKKVALSRAWMRSRRPSQGLREEQFKVKQQPANETRKEQKPLDYR